MNNSQAQITLGARHRTKTNKTNKNEQFTGADNIGCKAQNKDKQNKKHMTEHNSDEQHGILTKKKKPAEKRYMVTFSCNLLSMRITSYYTSDYRF
jgi:uncharacterized protein (DUF608 family)